MQRQKRDWAKIIEEHQRSGRSVKEFCEPKGIHPTTFYKNRKLCKQQPLVEIPVSGYMRGSSIVLHAGRYSVSIQNGFDRQTLKSVLEVIGETS
jgi:hypothetical protein